jgi:lipid-A-disaccharide synthase
MAEVAKGNADYQFVVAEVDNLEQSLYDPLRNLENVRFVIDRTYDLLLNSNAAIVTSGTATLETALFNVPQIVVYKTSTLSYWLAKMLVKVPFISLVNLIAGKEVVKELIQDEANEKNISDELKKLILGKKREEVLDGYKKIVESLDTGGSASENTARLMVKYLGKG